MTERDYSGTPLPKKLGISPDSRVFISSAPYSPAGADIRPILETTTLVEEPADLDVWLFFTTSREKLESTFAVMAERIRPDGAVWIAYPKKSSKVREELESDVDFGAVQEIGLAAGLVDNKSCAIDDDWTAVRFVYRKEDRPR